MHLPSEVGAAVKAFYRIYFSFLLCVQWGGTVGWDTVLQWKVAGSIPDGVTGIFHWYNPSGRTMDLGSTHPLKEMSTRNISWGVSAAGA